MAKIWRALTFETLCASFVLCILAASCSAGEGPIGSWGLGNCGPVMANEIGTAHGLALFESGDFEKQNVEVTLEGFELVGAEELTFTEVIFVSVDAAMIGSIPIYETAELNNDRFQTLGKQAITVKPKTQYTFGIVVDSPHAVLSEKDSISFQVVKLNYSVDGKQYSDSLSYDIKYRLEEGSC